MRILPRLGVLCAGLSVSVLSVVALANAQQQPNMVAVPFIADQGALSKSYSAGVASTGKQNPIFVSRNSGDSSEGSYSGILISSENPNVTRRCIDALSFSYKGENPIETMVEFTPNGHSARRSFTTIKPNAKNGFTNIVLSKEQLGIPKDSSWNKIVISDAGITKKNYFLVDNIQIDNNPIRKVLNSVFFDIGNGLPTGPLGAFGKATAAAAPPPTLPITGLTVTNRYGFPVQLYMQLLPIAGCTAAPLDVQTVFPNMTYVGAGTTLGVMKLTPALTKHSSITTKFAGPLSATFSVGYFNPLCPTNITPNGVNVAEVIINNSCQSVTAPQETMDISLVNGLNSLFKFSVVGNSFSTVTNTSVTPNTVVNLNSISNKSLFSQNFSVPGVYPYGCTNCTNSAGAQTCPVAGFPMPPASTFVQNPPPYGSCNPSQFIGCNMSRNANTQSGGTITLQYLGPAAGFAPGTTLLNIFEKSGSTF